MTSFKNVFIGISFLFSSIFFSILVSAQQFTVEGGFRQQSGEVKSARSVNPQNGYQIGAAAVFDLSAPLYFRTGLFYTQRPLVAKNTLDQEQVFKMNYFDLPATVLYRFTDMAAVYGGLILSSNLEKSWTVAGISVDAQEVKSIIAPFVLGGQMRFTPEIGANAYFEFLSGEIAKGLSDYRAVGVNMTFTFD